MDAETVRSLGTLVARNGKSGSKLYAYKGSMWRIFGDKERFAYCWGNDKPGDRHWAFGQDDRAV